LEGIGKSPARSEDLGQLFLNGFVEGLRYGFAMKELKGHWESDGRPNEGLRLHGDREVLSGDVVPRQDLLLTGAVWQHILTVSEPCLGIDKSGALVYLGHLIEQKIGAERSCLQLSQRTTKARSEFSDRHCMAGLPRIESELRRLVVVVLSVHISSPPHPLLIIIQHY
jgi:hypothetical protein